MAITRVANIIRVLAAHLVVLSDTLLIEAYGWVVERDAGVKELLFGDEGDALVGWLSVRGHD
jgi:exosome complex component RRP4